MLLHRDRAEKNEDSDAVQNWSSRSLKGSAFDRRPYRSGQSETLPDIERGQDCITTSYLLTAMSYKSTGFRAQPPSNSDDKYKAKAKQLQELFPVWSYDGKSTRA